MNYDHAARPTSRLSAAAPAPTGGSIGIVGPKTAPPGPDVGLVYEPMTESHQRAAETLRRLIGIRQRIRGESEEDKVPAEDQRPTGGCLILDLAATAYNTHLYLTAASRELSAIERALSML
jgi:hypothetical protein